MQKQAMIFINPNHFKELLLINLLLSNKNKFISNNFLFMSNNKKFISKNN